ncbi:MAG TPA: hypothetical protein EYQ50_05835 [Verrucomicrobiales bacterium]|nr:hypothetical protein [Verrucomicrobiales bacterium]HIL68891.1 hypothetical protein [Verrucomicrobiota bacterium]
MTKTPCFWWFHEVSYGMPVDFVFKKGNVAFVIAWVVQKSVSDETPIGQTLYFHFFNGRMVSRRTTVVSDEIMAFRNIEIQDRHDCIHLKLAI